MPPTGRRQDRAEDGPRQTLVTGALASALSLLVVAGVLVPRYLQVGVVSVASASELGAVMDDMNYRLAVVRSGIAGVPRIALASLPAGMEAIGSIEERKRVFLRVLLPLVLAENEQILDDRARVLGIARSLGADEILARAEHRELTSIALGYLFRPRDGTWSADDIAELLRRVDAVPPSLALAQAAVESGWGTSRFAREGNALFGQSAWDGAGMAPMGRADPPYRVATFDTLQDSVAAYMANLNTHRAYRTFRRLRSEQRAAGAPMDAGALAGTLLAYAETGEAYARLLREVIDDNDLPTYDAADFEDGRPTVVLAAR